MRRGPRFRFALASATAALALAAFFAPAGARADGGAAPDLEAQLDAPSRLAMPLPPRPSADGILAQRAIERAWGPADESEAQARARMGWRSEPAALTLSGLVPGAGQYYVGENGAAWYALAEAAGWTARWLFQRDAGKKKDAVARFAGNPADSTSGWSYKRWIQAEGDRDPTALEALYASDRGAFYALIARDPAYLQGWAGADPSATQASFQDLRDQVNRAEDRRRDAEIALILNHLVSAADALRLARFHNLPIRRNLELKLKSSWHAHGPALAAVLERRF